MAKETNEKRNKLIETVKNLTYTYSDVQFRTLLSHVFNNATQLRYKVAQIGKSRTIEHMEYDQLLAIANYMI